MSEIIIYETSDESIELHINGTYITSADHDTDGWAGMSKFREVVKAMASAFNVEVEEVYVGD